MMNNLCLSGMQMNHLVNKTKYYALNCLRLLFLSLSFSIFHTKKEVELLKITVSTWNFAEKLMERGTSGKQN